ncbi:MAG: hypothetical protein JSU87_05185 [Gemmatimonadota bacterium]|nr:MAG: hypothetical protein JSU87_05185 [Gemmatimonadota bacterium]
MGRQMLWRLVAPFALAGMLAAPRLWAQEPDTEYAERIQRYTTDPRFSSDLVDHLPRSEAVPSPLDHFGEIIGAPDILHDTEEIYGYMRALADASPRVEVRGIGLTEEGREMIEVIIADESTLADLERYRGYLGRLADPRALEAAEAREIIAAAKPVYYLTAGLHSPETGAPEMVMELAYRLAVEETPLVRAIRDNVITVIVPVLEPDGRDRMVDVYRYTKAHGDVGPGLPYWGKYVAHDNNRDGFGLALALTRNSLTRYLYWKPTVMHDLHESGYYLYVSTGSGPYNEEIDALTIDEWHNISHEEVTQLTKRGMPGVWTHAFYTGWAANYLMWIANTRNSIGRFYETLGNRGADTMERELRPSATSREWYRPNPPLEKAMWSLRNNTNYMQSGVLVALKYVADRGGEFLDNFYLRGVRAVEKGASQAPYAWVIPPDQRRPLATAELVNLLMEQGVEVHIAEEDLKWSAEGGKSEGADDGGAERSAPRGSYVVRLDQPYRTLVRVLLDVQKFPEDAQPPYDDTGWTLPYLHQVEAHRVDDPGILSARMRLLEEPTVVAGALNGRNRDFYLVNNTTDDNFAQLRFRLGQDINVQAAEAQFEADRRAFAAGSFIIPAAGNPADLSDRLEEAARELGLEIHGTGRSPDVAMHTVEVPRVALVHTWVSTPQDAGWWRFAFDHIGIPYTHLSEQDLATADLSSFDVVIMPRTRADPQTLIGGTTEAGVPIPWRRDAQYPSIGVIDETDDVRLGMGYDGLKNLKEFVAAGGVFITEGSTAALPIDMAITRRVQIKRTGGLVARGTVLKAMIADAASPIVYGYPESLAVYFNQTPVFEVSDDLDTPFIPEWLKDEIWEKEVPRVVVKFAKEGTLMSGMLRGAGEIADTPAVIDAPVGRGHVVLFANRPFWRWETRGSHALVFNTLLHWNDLRVGWPSRPETSGETTVAEGR